MKIILAEHSGFCMGVRNAVIKIVHELNSTSEKIYIHGPLIHNPQTVEALKKRGLIPVTKDDDYHNKPIAIRTHGIPYNENKNIKNKASRTINLTCSRVSRVQSIIKKYSAKGYYTLICGDKDHAEVTSLKSYASKGFSILTQLDDIDNVPSKKKYLLVSQTTYDREFLKEVEDVLNKKKLEILTFDTICDSTKLRQDDVYKAIDEGIDTLVVIGGKNSANTTRLVEIGEFNKIKTIHIETEEELIQENFNNSEFVLVTAGASTPGWIINNVLEKIYHFKYQKGNFLKNKFKTLFEMMVRTHFLTSISASLLSIIFQIHTTKSINILFPIITFFYLFSMFSINNILEIYFLKASNALKYNIYKKFKIPMLFISFVFIILIIYTTLLINFEIFLFFILMLLSGAIYSTGIIKKLIQNINNNLFRKIYHSKIVISGGAALTITIPILIIDYNISLLVLLFYSFAFFYIRQNLIDLIALNSDLILGKESIPVVLGKDLNYKLSIVIISLGIIVPLILSIMYKSLLIILLVTPLFYFAFLLKKMVNTKYLFAVKNEFLVDYSAFFLFIITIIELIIFIA